MPELSDPIGDACAACAVQAWYWSWLSYEFQEKDASKEAVDADAKNAEALEVPHLKLCPPMPICSSIFLCIADALV